MEEFLKDLQSLHWWLGVVVVGIVVGVISNHLPRFILVLFGGINKTVLKYSKQQREKFEKDVDWLVKFPEEQIFFYLRIVRDFILFSTYTIMSFVSFFSSQILYYITAPKTVVISAQFMGVLTLVLSVGMLYRIIRKFNIIIASRKRLYLPKSTDKQEGQRATSR